MHRSVTDRSLATREGRVRASHQVGTLNASKGKTPLNVNPLSFGRDHLHPPPSPPHPRVLIPLHDMRFGSLLSGEALPLELRNSAPLLRPQEGDALLLPHESAYSS